MNKKVKIGFNESSKAITADLNVEWTLAAPDEIDTFNNEQALNEVEALFLEAQTWAANQTMRRKL